MSSVNSVTVYSNSGVEQEWKHSVIELLLCYVIVKARKLAYYGHTIRYDTRCYFNVRSKADMSQLNLRHGTDN